MRDVMQAKNHIDEYVHFCILQYYITLHLSYPIYHYIYPYTNEVHLLIPCKI